MTTRHGCVFVDLSTLAPGGSGGGAARLF